ncbi:MAG: hypothetical protein KDK60_01505 [Chlamydiia bacterium]|nr:hypothetical protein [Chlamydiia bacterium]
MSHIPEKDLSHHLHNQEEEVHNNLFIINKLYKLCNNNSLSEVELVEKARPLIESLGKTNPIVAKELYEVLKSGDLEKINGYFKAEKAKLAEDLQREIKEHKGINQKINRETNDEHPTIS